MTQKRERKPVKVTIQQIKNAIEQSYGHLTNAAKALGISRWALYQRIHRSPELRRFVDDMREARIDTAENRLMDMIESGNVAATIFLLKTQGKDRGWVERQEVDHRGDLTVQVVRYSDVVTNAKAVDGGGED